MITIMYYTITVILLLIMMIMIIIITIILIIQNNTLYYNMRARLLELSPCSPGVQDTWRSPTPTKTPCPRPCLNLVQTKLPISKGR